MQREGRVQVLFWYVMQSEDDVVQKICLVGVISLAWLSQKWVLRERCLHGRCFDVGHHLTFFAAQNTACLILTFALPQKQEYVNISLQYFSSFCKYQHKFPQKQFFLCIFFTSYEMTGLKTYLFFGPLNFLLSIFLVCLQCYNVHIVSLCQKLRIMTSNEKQIAETGEVLE